MATSRADPDASADHSVVVFDDSGVDGDSNVDGQPGSRMWRRFFRFARDGFVDVLGTVVHDVAFSLPAAVTSCWD